MARVDNDNRFVLFYSGKTSYGNRLLFAKANCDYLNFRVKLNFINNRDIAIRRLIHKDQPVVTEAHPGTPEAPLEPKRFFLEP